MKSPSWSFRVFNNNDKHVTKYIFFENVEPHGKSFWDFLNLNGGHHQTYVFLLMLSPLAGDVFDFLKLNYIDMYQTCVFDKLFEPHPGFIAGYSNLRTNNLIT